MQTYMDTFARFKEGREQLDELETMLKSYPQLEFWEKSQLSKQYLLATDTPRGV